MAIVQVKDATGSVLDWMVAKCAGYLHKQDYGWTVVLPVPGEPPTVHLPFPKHFSPSTRWAQGGPIIEREKIELIPPKDEDDNEWMAVWYKCEDVEAGIQVGTSPLIAAMRCYVASKLGDQVEVPDELI